MAEVVHTGKGRRIDLDGSPINLGDSTAASDDDSIVDIVSGADGVFVRFRGEGTTHVTVGHGGQSVTVGFSAEAAPLEGVTFEEEIPLA